MKRFIMALLTGNGDLHMENMSIIQHDHTLSFSPVYDPTPVRAYSIHNMLSVMPFGNYGELQDDRDAPIGLIEAINNFSKNLGISQATLSEIIEFGLRVTEGYKDRVL